MEFPAEWLVRAHRPSSLSTQVVPTDRWDREDLAHALDDLPSFGLAAQELAQFTPTGDAAVFDAFYALLKAGPELLPLGAIRPSHMINRVVIAQLLEVEAFERLRAWSVGDRFQSGQSAAALEPVLEMLFERLDLAQSLAQSLQFMLDGMWATDSLGAAGEDAVRTSFDRIMEIVGDNVGSMRALLYEANERLVTETAEATEAALSWGVQPGELRRLPAAERLAMAEKLNTPRMHDIAEMFGRLRTLAFSNELREDNDLPQQISDLELGADLSRVTPGEMMLLGDPVLENEFFARWSDRELLVYEMYGEETMGRGGIVFCADTSGSMRGPREIFCKATMLVLLHIAHVQGRRMHVLHFGASGEITHIPFVRPEDFSASRIIDAAEMNFGAGTSFVTPMNMASRLLRQEVRTTGRRDADVVFATDDECQIPKATLDAYLADMHDLEAQTWGLMVARAGRPRDFVDDIDGVNPNGALATMCEGRVLTVHDLQSGGDIRALLRRQMQPPRRATT